jgi:hypothetical protein
MRVGFLAGVLIAAALFLGDAVGTVALERRVAREATGKLGGPTTVDLRGWPVTVRLLAGNVAEVGVRAADVPLDASGATLASLDATLTDVAVDPGAVLAGRQPTPRARAGSFTAVLDEANVERLAGAPVDLTLRQGTAVFRARGLPIEASAAVEDGKVVLRPSTPGLSRFALRVALPGLPEGLVVERAQVEPGRVVLFGSVRELTL